MSAMTKLRTLASQSYSYIDDFLRFWNHSQNGNLSRNQHTSKAHLLRIAHALEKGMVLPTPRSGFGQDKMEQILTFIQNNAYRWPLGREEAIAFASVERLLDFHEQRGLALHDLREKADALKGEFPSLALQADDTGAGAVRMTREDVLASLPKDPQAFFTSRRSIRQFGPRESFDFSILPKAVELAQRAPSVCNRQTCKAYIFTDPVVIKQLLKHQDGNTGFGDTASALVICTSDLANFYKIGERNQGFVDGGLFAMALVYAFHGLGAGTCMLNWSQPAHKDKAFRRICRIPAREVIITMMAVGSLKDEFEVAASPRRALSSVLQLDDVRILNSVPETSH